MPGPLPAEANSCTDFQVVGIFRGLRFSAKDSLASM